MITVDSPMQAVSLHKGGVDMVVYYPDEEDHFQLLASDLDCADAATSARIRMAQSDGTRVSFNQPGVSLVSYRFERIRSSVTAPADLLGRQVASK